MKRHLKLNGLQKSRLLISLILLMLPFSLTYGQDDTPAHVVTSVAWSPDGTMIAIGYGTGRCVPDRPDLYTIEILKAATNQVIHTLPGGNCSVIALDWSPDGSKLASASWDSIGIRIWDVVSGQLLVTKQTMLQSSFDVSWRPDGTQLAITDISDVVMILDATTGEILNTVARGIVVDWSPDGSKILSASDSENTVFVTDTVTWQQLMALNGHTNSMRAVDWSPDGSKFASGSIDDTVRIWDAVTGNLLLTLQGHTDAVTDVVWSPDSQRLASSSLDGTIRVWDMVTGIDVVLVEQSGGTFTLDWSPDGTKLAYGVGGDSVEIIEVTEDIPAATPTVGNQDVVSSVAWSPDGSMIAISGGEIGCDSTNIAGFAVRIFDADTGQIAKKLLGMTCTSSGVDWSPDGSQLVSFNSVQSVAYIWDVSTEILLRTVPLNTQGMSSVVWSPNGDLVASGTPGNSIILWDPASGQIVSPSVGGTSADWNPDGSRLVSGSPYDNLVIIQDMATRQELMTLVGSTAFTYSVDWSPSGNRIVAAGSDNFARVWDASSGQLLLSLTVPNLTDARWSPDGQKLATASTEGVVQVWDAITGAELARFSSSTPIYAVDWSPDGTRLAYGAGGDSIEIVEVNEDIPAAAPTVGDQDVVSSVAWSPDGTRIAIGKGEMGCSGDHNSIDILDAASGLTTLELVGHTCEVNSVAWNTDGSRLASASSDGTIRIWDSTTGQILSQTQSLDSGRTLAEWHPDGSQVAGIIDGDGGVEILDPMTGSRLSYLCCVPGAVRDVAWNIDGSQLAIAGDVVQIWNVQTQQASITLSGDSSPVTAVSWNSNGTIIATGHKDGHIHLWDGTTGVTSTILQGHTNAISELSWGFDGVQLASSGLDGTIRVWDTSSNQQLGVFSSPAGEVIFSVDWNPNGSQLVYGGDFSGNQENIVIVTAPQIPPLTPTATPTVGDQDVVSSVAWSPDGSMIAISGGEIGCDSTNIAGFAVRIFDADTGQTAKKLLGMTCTSSGVDWSPDSSKLVSFNVAQSIAYIWDVATEQLIMTVPIESQGMLSVVWSPNSNLIASGFPSNGIGIWSSTTGQMVGRAGGTTLDWSPDGTKLATGSYYDNLIIIQDHTTEEEIITISGHIDIVYSVAWSPDGTKLASASKDDTARVWSVTSGQLLLTLRIPDVVDARWSPDSQKLATASTEGVVQVWDAITGAELARFSSSTPIYAIDWSPDGTKLAYFDAEIGRLQIISAPEIP